MQRNLRTARCLLLVVGDGIRESLESMLGYLHRQPQMLFTFGLVEMQIYESPDLFSGHLLLPMLVAQTTEVVRAVVRVQTTGQASVEVSIEESDESKPASARRTLSEELFFAELPDDDTRAVFRDILDFAVDLGAVPAWRSSGVSIQLPDPGGSDKRLTLFVMTTGGDVYTGWPGDQLGTVGLDADMGYDYVRAVAALFSGATQSQEKPDNLSRSTKFRELRTLVDAFKDVVRDTVGKIQESQP